MPFAHSFPDSRFLAITLMVQSNQMKLLVLFFLMFNLGIQFLFAQPGFHWAKRVGGNSYFIKNHITVDNYGNVYTVGSYYIQDDFDPGPGTFILTPWFHDIFITKLDSNGKFLWAKSLGGPNADRANSVTIASNGDILVTGYFAATVDFDPGPNVFNLTALAHYDLFLLRLDARGEFIWAKSIAGSYHDWGYSVKVDIWDHIYLTGSFWYTADFDPGPGVYNLTSAGSWDIFVCKLDADGSFIWAKSIGGSADDEGYNLAVDDSGSVYYTGRIENTVDVDPGPGTYFLTALEEDIITGKLDFNGNFVWATRLGTTNNSDYGYGVAVDRSENVYYTGYLAGSGLFIVKLNRSGNSLWQNTYGFGFGCAIEVVADSILYLTGINGDIVRLDSAGNILCRGVIPGTYVTAVCSGPGNSFYISGSFDAIKDFDPGPGVFYLTPGAQGITYVAKLDDCLPLLTGEENGNKKNCFNVSPNPSNGIINCQLSVVNIGTVGIEVFDVLGKKCFSASIIHSTSNIQIDLSGQPDGLYLINIQTERGMISKKLIVAR
jgi:hypothetical protein